MSATDVSDTLQVALQGSGLNQVKVLHRPRLLSDNGPSYVSNELGKWLEASASAQRESGNYMADPQHPRLSMGPPNSYCSGPSPTRFTCGPRAMQKDKMQPVPLKPVKAIRR